LPAISSDMTMKTLKGYGVSPGFSVGQVLKVEQGLPPVYKFRIADDAVLERELLRFDEAIARTTEELRSFQHKLEEKLGRDHSLMIQAHIMILQDHHFSGAIRDYIRAERVNAEWAVTVINERIREAYRKLQDPYLQDKIFDIQDIAARLLNNIAGWQENHAPEHYENIILVSSEVNLSLLGLMDFSHLKGFAVDSGGWTSHTSIIARSLEIPAVIHLKNITSLVHTGDLVLLDGSSGTVHINPDAATVARFHQQARSVISPATESGPYCLLPEGETEPVAKVDKALRDLRIYLNSEMPLELGNYQRFGVSGIGLFRSEFVFLRKSTEKITLADHLEVYQQLAEAAYPGTVNIRTLDLGADKFPETQGRHPEINPALGLRGIRLSLELRDLFRDQLKAIVMANTRNNLQVTIPFVSSLDEILAVKVLLRDVSREVTGRDESALPLGAMLEIPSTFFLVDLLAREVDFFALGSNDLVQYILARDRNNMPHWSPFDSAQPGVRGGLELLRRKTAEHKKEIICCGEMASHPFFVLMLLALGYRSLSINPAMLPLIRYITRTVDGKSLRRFYQQLSALHTLPEIEDFFLHRLGDYFPEPLVKTLLHVYRAEMD